MTTETDLYKANALQIQKLIGQALDGCGRVLSRLAVEEATRDPAIDAVRRSGANFIQAWRYCARSTCHRKRCCRGEPLHCLRLAVPLLPEHALQGLVEQLRPPRRRAPAKRGRLRP